MVEVIHKGVQEVGDFLGVCVMEREGREKRERRGRWRIGEGRRERGRGGREKEGVKGGIESMS